MNAERFVNRLLDDEGLTSDLEDMEACMLIEWATQQIEQIAGKHDNEQVIWAGVEQVLKRAKLIRQFLVLWCYKQDAGAAAQLIATEKCHWPLPDPDIDEPAYILQQILMREQNYDWNGSK